MIKTEKIIAVYGLGNVGGPLAAAWLRAGFKVIGVDISNKLLTDIKLGLSHSKEPLVSEVLTKSFKNGNLLLTLNGIAASKKSQIKIIAVAVGLKNNHIDLDALKIVSKNIAKGLKKEDAVLVSPSVPPHTTQKVILPILENYSGLIGEQEFYLIYNPERIFEGRALQDIEENYPAVVAGLGNNSLKFGVELLKNISKRGVLSMTTLANAEAEKLFEGVYRDVNIALANELADFCEKIGINYWEARRGANSQPYCHLHYPGTGVGGLCIPVYPRFVLESASKIGEHLKIVEFGRKTNDLAPKRCVVKALNMLSKNKKEKNIKVAVLGLGFRGEVSDSRLSPTYTIVNEFLSKGYKVAVHDPYILKDGNLPAQVKLSSDLSVVTKHADLIFISSDHKLYTKLNDKSFETAKQPILIFDGRNILNLNNFKKSNVVTIGK